MKFNAIANRGSKKDFYDVAELLKHHTLNERLGQTWRSVKGLVSDAVGGL